MKGKHYRVLLRISENVDDWDGILFDDELRDMGVYQRPKFLLNAGYVIHWRNRGIRVTDKGLRWLQKERHKRALANYRRWPWLYYKPVLTLI